MAELQGNAGAAVAEAADHLGTTLVELTAIPGVGKAAKSGVEGLVETAVEQARKDAKNWAGSAQPNAMVVSIADIVPNKISLSNQADNVTGAQWNQHLSEKYGADNVFWDWPKNEGFVYGADSVGSLQPGQLLGRLGNERGTFVSPLGTKPETLSLRPGTDTSNLNVYRVVDVDNARIGPAAPAFDMPGYGEQIQLPLTVKELVKSGQLERVTK
ncbi:MAG: TNT domain-containing protein [Marinobacter sp.]|uniref:TNT domain-containing protein n=1 Tax=Marinobacter sp. TaxID=50741 RepID=UPI001B4B1AA3|nr:TNT domain-containing protein [Marinobacter sp.]MBQ0746316.1 TNT domain-containing protein [Marinobacter sp.]MBQ0813836.1 TNT domain-containing protein [Marinobacter sp.]